MPTHALSEARFLALRLPPGTDLRAGIEAAFAESASAAGFVAACVGSLTEAHLRLADRHAGTVVPGPLEIVALSGTLARDGPHLHLAVADAEGAMRGGHLLHGCPVRTTAEIVLGLLDGASFGRERDPARGWNELVVSGRR